MHPKNRAKKIIAAVEQMVVDVDAWNKRNPNEPPLDCEVELVILSKAKAFLREFESGNTKRAQQLADDLDSYGKLVLGSNELL
jgi:hypothetical protein